MGHRSLIGRRTRVGMMVSVGMCALGVFVALAGCGSGVDDRRQVLRTVNEFARATAGRDYQTLCDSVLAPSVTQPLAQLGLPCPQALAKGMGGVRNPQLLVRRVDVLGRAALVVVRASADNQLPTEATLQLVKTTAGWRVSSLAQPRGHPGVSTPALVRTPSSQPTPLR